MVSQYVIAKLWHHGIIIARHGANLKMTGSTNYIENWLWVPCFGNVLNEDSAHSSFVTFAQRTSNQLAFLYYLAIPGPGFPLCHLVCSNVMKPKFTSTQNQMI